MAKLTKRTLDTMTCPEGKGQHRVYDAANPGFGVTLSKTGRRTFFVEYVPPGGGNRRRMTIGTYGPMTLDQARDEAHRVLGEVAAKRDPLVARESERVAGTFRDWTTRYLELGKASGRWGTRTLEGIERHLARANEAFGYKRLGDLDARTIEVWRNFMKEAHGLVTANRALSTVGACLREAWRRGLIPSVESAKVSHISGELPRTRTLSDVEMEKLLDAVAKQGDPFLRAALLWLVATGARRSEVLRAQWNDLRLDPPDRAEWTIPKPKNKRPSVRPIPAELAAELQRLPRDSVLVVGHRWTERQFHSEWLRLRTAAGLPEDVKLHDLRRTAGLNFTRQAGLQVAQRLLGHATISTTARTYAPLTTDDLRGPQTEVVAKVLAFRKTEEK